MNPIETVYTSGSTLYAVVHHTDGRVWNQVNQAFEAYNAANWAEYAVALTEQGAGYFRGTFPAAAAGDFLTTEVVYLQAGGAPALIDAPATGVGQSQGVDVASVAKSVTAATRLALTLGNMATGSVAAGVSTASAFFTDLADTVNAYQGRIVLFTSGVLIRQVANIVSFNPTTNVLTVAGPFTAAPGLADTFIIV